MTALAMSLVIPWAAGAVLLMIDGRRAAVGWAAVAALAATLIVLSALMMTVTSDGPVVVTTGDWPAGVGITLRADALGVVFALLSVLVLLAATIHEVADGVRERPFPGLVVLLAAGLTGVFLTADLFNFYVFFELALTASYVLATYGGSRQALGAALVFTAVNLLGTFVFLISVAGVYHVTGTLGMAQIGERMADVDPNAALILAVGFFVAFSVKLGLFPFHFWLPTVYTGARPAVAAILSGGLANIGAYGLLRFGAGLLPRELELGAAALIVIGCASILYGGILAISRSTTTRGPGIFGHRPGWLCPGCDRRRWARRLRGRDPIHRRQLPEQDDAVPDGQDAWSTRRWRVRGGRAERGRRTAGGRIHRQARAVHGRGRPTDPAGPALSGQRPVIHLCVPGLSARFLAHRADWRR